MFSDKNGHSSKQLRFFQRRLTLPKSNYADLGQPADLVVLKECRQIWSITKRIFRSKLNAGKTGPLFVTDSSSYPSSI